MYLVDTSVWIDYLRGQSGRHVAFLDALLDNPLATGLCNIIYMEILQGARDFPSFERLQRYFSTQRFYDFVDARKAHESAAQLFLTCRQKGFTVRSTLDCLIAQCAIEHNLVLLHNDRDYVGLGKSTANLRQHHFLD